MNMSPVFVSNGAVINAATAHNIEKRRLAGAILISMGRNHEHIRLPSIKIPKRGGGSHSSNTAGWRNRHGGAWCQPINTKIKGKG